MSRSLPSTTAPPMGRPGCSPNGPRTSRVPGHGGHQVERRSWHLRGTRVWSRRRANGSRFLTRTTSSVATTCERRDRFARANPEIEVMSAKPVILQESTGSIRRHPRRWQYADGTRPADLTAEPNVFLGVSPGSFFRLDRSRAAALEFDTRIAPELRGRTLRRQVPARPPATRCRTPPRRGVRVSQASRRNLADAGQHAPPRPLRGRPRARLPRLHRAGAAAGWLGSRMDPAARHLRAVVVPVGGRADQHQRPGAAGAGAAVPRAAGSDPTGARSGGRRQAPRPAARPGLGRPPRACCDEDSIGIRRRWSRPAATGRCACADTSTGSSASRLRRCSGSAARRSVQRFRRRWPTATSSGISCRSGSCGCRTCATWRWRSTTSQCSRPVSGGRHGQTDGHGRGQTDSDSRGARLGVLARLWRLRRRGSRALANRLVRRARRVMRAAVALSTRVAAASRPFRTRFRDAWVLMDRIHDADDNGERLFDHLRASRPDVNAWFVLERGTPDWERLRARGERRLVAHGSWTWKMLMLNCTWLLASHIDKAISLPPADPAHPAEAPVASRVPPARRDEGRSLALVEPGGGRALHRRAPRRSSRPWPVTGRPTAGPRRRHATPACRGSTAFSQKAAQSPEISATS